MDVESVSEQKNKVLADERQKSMDLQVQKNIFIAFFRSSILGYGGGPSTIPLVHTEVVKNFKWMNDDEFSDVLALGNTLPGPINTKMAGYIGYRVGGIVGLFNAIIATVMPTVLIMIALIGFISSFRDSPIVQGMTEAVMPVVGVMMATLTYSFVKQSQQGLGWKQSIILLIITIIVSVFLGIHPALLILLLLAYALFKK